MYLLNLLIYITKIGYSCKVLIGLTTDCVFFFRPENIPKCDIIKLYSSTKLLYFNNIMLFYFTREMKKTIRAWILPCQGAIKSVFFLKL